MNASGGWELYSEGLKFFWIFKFSHEDIAAFGKMSSDQNPIHTDPEFAKSKGFSGPIVYGLLLASQVSRLVGEELPDKHAMLTGLKLDFLRPAFPDQMLKFEAILDNKSDAIYALEFKCKIYGDDELLCKGTASAVWRR